MYNDITEMKNDGNAADIRKKFNRKEVIVLCPIFIHLLIS